MQSLQDAHIYSGWIEGAKEDFFIFAPKSKKVPVLKEQLYVEVESPFNAVAFLVVVTDHIGSRLCIKLASEVKTRPLNVEPRLQVSRINGALHHDYGTIPLSVIDISENGFGCVSEEQLSVGQCDVSVITHHGEIKMEIQIRHSRQDPEGKVYRGGVRILEMDRISRARWNRLLQVA
jgi:hypothetical protein